MEEIGIEPWGQKPLVGRLAPHYPLLYPMEQRLGCECFLTTGGSVIKHSSGMSRDVCHGHCCGSGGLLLVSVGRGQGCWWTSVMHTNSPPSKELPGCAVSRAEAENPEPRDILTVHSSPLHTCEGIRRFSAKVLSDSGAVPSCVQEHRSMGLNL